MLIKLLSKLLLFQDTTTYVHVHNPINDAVEDPMNASLKKKVIEYV